MPHEAFRPRVTTQAELEQLWRRLVKPLGFSGYSLWFVVIEDDHVAPQVTEINEMPESPEDDDGEALAVIIGELGTAGARLAFLRSRPGGGRPTPGDRAWARVLYDAARRARAHLDVVHLAHDHDVLPLPMDDVIAESA